MHLFGQSAAEQVFLDSLASGRLHHGWLITGPEGVGKATLAYRIARTLLALRPGDVPPQTLDMSPDATVFRHVASLGEPRLQVCRRPWDDKRKTLKAGITVDEVRKLKGFFNLSAADGGWRVAIIDAADEMNVSAANALLKILEEPPANAALLLVAHQPGRLLPTIRSRCRTLTCSNLSDNDLGLALDGAGMALPADMTALSQLSGGSAGAALQLVQAEGEELYSEIVAALSSLPRLDRGLVLGFADQSTGRDAAKRYHLIVNLVLLALNRLAKGGATGMAPPEAARGEGDLIHRLAPDAACGRAWADLAQMLASRTAHAIAVNLDPGNVILDMFLNIEKTAARRAA